MKYLQKLQSRKFQLALVAVLSALVAGLTREVTWFQAILAIVTAVSVYVGVEGAIDYKSVKTPTK